MKLDFVNLRGDTLPLVNNPFFHIVNVDGMTRANANLSSVVNGNDDGDTVNNVQAQPRLIVLDLRIRSNVNVEDAKRAVTKIVKFKQNGSLIWKYNGRTTKISGIAEAVEMPRWNNETTMQIQLHCEQPYWEDIDYVISQINEAIDLHYFTDMPDDMLYFPEEGIPFGEYDFSRSRALYNAGDVAVGIEIEIIAFDTVTNPIIYDMDGNFFGVGYCTGDKKVVMQSGDIIRINTGKGKKSVMLNGSTSLLGKLRLPTTWLELKSGDNQFFIDSDDESIQNMTFSIKYKQRYI